MPLPPGIPTLAAYRQLRDSSLFKDVEAYSDAFLARNRRDLRAYRWAPDPMRQWSRRWEYPFCLDHLVACGGATGLAVLDAGSGITFFPFLLASRGFHVECCDIDRSLAPIFARVSDTMGLHVPFSACDLAALPHADATFDALYCISVLEHCREYGRIVDEFSRVLRPGGLLVLSFDISLDGLWDIPPARARELLRSVGARFSVNGVADPAALLEHGPEAEIVTTRAALADDPRSLPWGILSDLKSLARLRLPRRPHKYLAFCAIAATKRSR